jgi:hypothetical protein
MLLACNRRASSPTMATGHSHRPVGAWEGNKARARAHVHVRHACMHAADGTVDQHQHSTLNRPKTVAHLEHHVVAVQRDISRVRVAAHARGRLLGSDKPGQASQKHHGHRCFTSDRESFENSADRPTKILPRVASLAVRTDCMCSLQPY